MTRAQKMLQALVLKRAALAMRCSEIEDEMDEIDQDLISWGKKLKEAQDNYHEVDDKINSMLYLDDPDARSDKPSGLEILVPKS